MMKNNKGGLERKRTEQEKHEEGNKRIKINTTNVELAEDMVFEILLHLPASAIVRFKAVCKRWLTLITDEHFLPRHLPLQIPRLDLLVHFFTLGPFGYQHIQFLYLPHNQFQIPVIRKFPRHPSFIMFPKDRYHPRCSLVDSCNGLLLFRFIKTTIESYYIFNPFSRNYTKLPSTTLVSGEKQEVESSTYIMFDPTISVSYKVIRWLKYEGEIHCLLYSSETGSWRSTSVGFPFDVRFSFNSRATLLEGVMYWSYWCTPMDVSYCFDVEKESVSSLALPLKPKGFSFRLCLYFGECDGRFVLIEKYSKTSDLYDGLPLPCTFDVLESTRKRMQSHQDLDFCNPWVVKYHVSMEKDSASKSLDDCIKFIHLYKNNGAGEEGEEGEEEVFLYMGDSFVTYNLSRSTFGKKLMVPKNSKFSFRNFFPFTTTLVPITKH